MAVSLLFACGLTACGGGGASLPTSSTLPGPSGLLPNSALALSSAVQPSSATATYTAPWGGFGAPGHIYLDPQGACAHIGATAAAGYSWPAMLSTLKPGTVVTLTGSPAFASGADRSNNCPTGGFVTSSVIVGTPAPATPAPTPKPTAPPTAPPTAVPVSLPQPPAPYTYVAPWGGMGSPGHIYVDPQGNCGHIAATAAANFSWPAFLATLAPGSTVTIVGTPSYASAADRAKGCPTGGIVATAVVNGLMAAVQASPTPTPSAKPSGLPIPVPTGVPVPSPSGFPSPSPKPTVAPTPPASSYAVMFPGFAGNHALPPNPVLHPQSQQMIAELYNNPNGHSMTGPALNDAQSTYYNASASDPVHTVHCNEMWGPASLGHKCDMDGKQIHIPAGAVPGANSDQHTSILSPDGCTLDDFWVMQKNMSAPVLYAEFGAEYNVCTGNGFVTGGGAGPTAGGGSNRLGHADLAELQTGVIHHAIEVAVACRNTATLVGQATSVANATPCSTAGPAIPMGAYLWSDITPAQLPANLDKATRMLCTAFNAYGGVVSDVNGGWNGLSLNSFWNASGNAAYAAWFTANSTNNATNPAACFPGGDWSHHVHVLAF